MFLLRLASAAVGIPLILLTIYAGEELLAAVVAAAVFIASLEIWSARGALRTVHALLAALLAAAIPVAAYYGDDWLLGAIAAAVLLPSTASVLSKDPKAGLEPWLWSIVTALYFGFLAAHFVLLRNAGDGREWLFFVVLLVWTADTGGYFVGRPLGARGHRLAPAISPGKSIEGAIGGFVAGFVAVFVLNAAFDLGLSPGHRIALGLILPPVTLLGDLAESALKRSLDIKDSSGLVPGHGGIADRMDSLLFAVPAVYYYLKWIIL